MLPHKELTTRVYADVVASAPPTIVIVFKKDFTISVYINDSSVCFVVFVELSKLSPIRFCKPQRVRVHRKPIQGIFDRVESGDDSGKLLVILKKVLLNFLLRKAFNLF